MWSSLHTSEMNFGTIVNELFENSYLDTDSCHQQTSMMDLYGKYQKAINECVAEYRKEEIHSRIPFIIERIRK